MNKFSEKDVKALLANGHPSMVSSDDFVLVREIARGLKSGSVILELGPWLGALSCELAGFGTLHVVDNFVWTKDHNRRVPNTVQPGESFLPLYKSIMDHKGVAPRIYQTDFSDFLWDGKLIDLLLIDSAKTPDALFECLRPIVSSLAPNAQILIKNGLNIKQHDMLMYIDRLVRIGLFDYTEKMSRSKSNILTMIVGDISEDAPRQIEAALAPTSNMSDVAFDGALQQGAYSIAKMIKLVEANMFPEAYEELSRLSPDLENVQLWERQEASLNTDQVSAADLATFCDILVHHNTPIASLQNGADLHKDPVCLLRSFWSQNADKPWRAQAFFPDLLMRVWEFGYTNWASRLNVPLNGKAILDVGAGQGLHGLGYLSLGATSYLGVDPAACMSRDRVKNLNSKKRAAFGWTPAQISRMVPPWNVRPVAIEFLESDEQFDLALMLDVLAHVKDLDSVCAKVASLLKEGGEVIIHHKNFYSWNGHQQKPNKVSDLDANNPMHQVLMDWGHIGWDAPKDHYISRELNRFRINDIIQAVERHLDVDTVTEIPMTPETGSGRLTKDIRERYPHLNEQDFSIQSVWITARARNVASLEAVGNAVHSSEVTQQNFNRG